MGNGYPSVTVAFEIATSNSITQSQKGTVALVIRDVGATGGMTLTSTDDIPSTLTAENTAYIERAFMGYVSAPKKVLVYALAADATDLTAALTWLATQSFDYLAGPPDCTATEAAALKTWILAQRKDYRIYKAVLPGLAADSEAIVNFTGSNIVVDGTTYSTAAYCSRIAGLLAGTPMTISSTFAPLTEIDDLDRLTAAQAGAANNAGQYVLVHDGTKAKTARGVNSLQTTTGKGECYKKIKIVETLDMVQSNIRTTGQDSYIGKYANTYDNKCLLIAAIKKYLQSLEKEGILKSGASTVSIDLSAQTAYIKALGVDTSELTEQEIREYNTGSKVFIAASIVPIDAIEDIAVNIELDEVS